MRPSDHFLCGDEATVHPVAVTGARGFFMGAITPSRAETLLIGGLSRRTGVNIETIRYYERIGMLPVPPRTEGGRRVYGPVQMQTLVFIKRGRELGFTLDQIRALLALGGSDKACCGDVREIAAKHLADIRAKIADLEKLERLLAMTIDRCEGGTAPECPVIEILTSAPKRVHKS
jgi:MerR family transcriptional regulator, mercuric resistance operon regulatory protein